MVYQIFPATFADSNGDGFGDLNGVTARLDYLAALGVDALWLTPVYPTPWHDSGYDVADYQDIDPRFGTLADFDALLAAAHQRGLKLMMDLVANHTSDQHPWFIESRSSRDNAYARLVLVAARRDRATNPARPGPSRPTGARNSTNRPGNSTTPPASTTCTCTPPSNRT